MKALMGSCLTPDLLSGPLHSVSAPLASMFIVSTNRVTDMVQPVIMPSSSWCQSDVSWPDETVKLISWASLLLFHLKLQTQSTRGPQLLDLYCLLAQYGHILQTFRWNMAAPECHSVGSGCSKCGYFNKFMSWTYIGSAIKGNCNNIFLRNVPAFYKVRLQQIERKIAPGILIPSFHFYAWEHLNRFQGPKTNTIPRFMRMSAGIMINTLTWLLIPHSVLFFLAYNCASRWLIKSFV